MDGGRVGVEGFGGLADRSTFLDQREDEGLLIRAKPLRSAERDAAARRCTRPATSRARTSDAASPPSPTARSSATAWPDGSATAIAARSGRPTDRQEREEQLGALGLALNAVAPWNSTHIQAALDQLTREGWGIDQADTARVSPLPFKHINSLGRHASDLPQAIAEGALRPLRNPNSE
jgi:Tn3 transposase DDE domain-containing protein